MLLQADKDSRHQALKERLVKKIGKCSINDRLPSERQLAEQYKICRATVNKVMVELEQEGYVTRRVGKGTFVMPHDKRVIQDGVSAPRTTGDVIIAYPDFFSFLCWERLHFAELIALRSNINLINVKLQPESTMQSVVNILEKLDNPLGVITMASGAKLSRAVLKKLDSFGIPVVLSGILPSGIYNNLYSVRQDHFKSGYLKMEHLLSMGHCKIGLAPNEPESEVGREHIKGVKQALYDNGMKWKDVFLPDKRPAFWDDPMTAGYEQTRELISKNDLTAILFDTITGAFGGLRALYETNLSCPDDISVIASSTHFGLESMSTPALSTVFTNNEQVIQSAFDIILKPDQMLNKNYIIDVELVIRESVKSINN